MARNNERKTQHFVKLKARKRHRKNPLISWLILSARHKKQTPREKETEQQKREQLTKKMAKRASNSKKHRSSSSSTSTKSITKISNGVKDKRAKPKRISKRQIAKLDSKKPKKPPTAFFYFLEDFRKDFQKQNPDVKSMREIGKACGEKWKMMTYEEKVKYYDIATEKRAEFDKAMAEYIKKKESGEFEEVEDDSEFDE
ncbi:DNA-binding protein MNB1B, putative [Ricinus communis]|uniref:DNA-binding protein MNB1B, putative n=1 Tax=Ricinus communis TaxID=3988 RepID=B9S139_RICCO|nr:DNA-binding protein MNB1B, putative [Ricinus communis]